MPDLVLLAKALLLAALTAAGFMWIAGRGAPRAWRRDVFWTDASWTWAIAAGILVACGATDQWPHWPPLEDRARFLTLLVPLTLVVETLAAFMPSVRAAWVARLGLAIVAAPILLHNTVYLADLNGPGSAEWPPALAALILCGLAATVAFVWAMLAGLQARTSTRAVCWLLFVDAMAVSVTVMLSGYYRGGVLGLALSGALAGATLGSWLSQPQPTTSGSLGMGVIGIFAVVLVGRFFGALSSGLAVCLLIAPLLAWIVELPRLRSLAPSRRAAARLLCVAIPLTIVVAIAWQKFTAASAAHSQPPPGTSDGEELHARPTKTSTYSSPARPARNAEPPEPRAGHPALAPTATNVVAA